MENQIDNNILDKKEQKDNIYEKSAIKVVIITIIVGLALICVSFIGYKFYKDFSNPKNRLVVGLKNYYEADTIKETIDKTNNLFKNGNTVNMNGDIKVSLNNIKLLNLNFNSNIIDNNESKERYISFLLNSNKENIINLEGIYKENNLYFTLKDILNKYYFLPIEELSNETDIDMDKVYDSILNSLDQYFTESKFVIGSKEIFINGKQEKTQMISVTLTEVDIIDLMKLIYNNLETVIDNENFKEIKDSLNEIDTSSLDPILFEYNVYLKGYNVLKQELIFKEEEMNFSVSFEGEKDNISFDIKENDVSYITGTITEDTISFKSADGNYSGTIKITNDEITDNSIKENINYEINIVNNGVNIKLEGNLVEEVNNKTDIPNIDISKSVSIDELSYEDINNMFNEILNRFEKAFNLEELEDIYNSNL